LVILCLDSVKRLIKTPQRDSSEQTATAHTLIKNNNPCSSRQLLELQAMHTGGRTERDFPQPPVEIHVTGSHLNALS